MGGAGWGTALMLIGGGLVFFVAIFALAIWAYRAALRRNYPTGTADPKTPVDNTDTVAMARTLLKAGELTQSQYDEIERTHRS